MALWQLAALLVLGALGAVLCGGWAIWRYRTMTAADYVEGLERLVYMAERELEGDSVSHAEFLLLTASGRKMEATWNRTDGVQAKATA